MSTRNSGLGGQAGRSPEFESEFAERQNPLNAPGSQSWGANAATTQKSEVPYMVQGAGRPGQPIIGQRSIFGNSGPAFTQMPTYTPVTRAPEPRSQRPSPLSRHTPPTSRPPRPSSPRPQAAPQSHQPQPQQNPSAASSAAGLSRRPLISRSSRNISRRPMAAISPTSRRLIRPSRRPRQSYPQTGYGNGQPWRAEPGVAGSERRRSELPGLHFR